MALLRATATHGHQMPLQSNVFRRGSRYVYRVRVPVRLIERVGRIEIWRSLNTSDPLVARRRSSRVAAGLGQVWVVVEAFGSMTRDEIDRLVQQCFLSTLREDEAQRLMDTEGVSWREAGDWTEFFERYLGAANVEKYLDDTGKPDLHFIRDAANEVALQESEAALRINNWRDAEAAAQHVLAVTGVNLDSNSLEYREFCLKLLRAMHQSALIIRARSNGDWSARSSDPLFRDLDVLPPAPINRPKNTPVRELPPISELLEKFLREKSTLEQKSLNDYRAAIRVFLSTMPANSSLTDITDHDIVRFKDLLLDAPKNVSKADRQIPLPQLVEKSKGADFKRLSSKTIRDKYLVPLSGFLKWAAKNRYIAANPADGITLEVSKRQAKAVQRRPFTNDELNRLFRANAFTGCWSDLRCHTKGNHKIRDHRYWAPMIGLWTGARLNEIGQLQASDVKEFEGILYFDMTTELSDEDGNPIPRKIKSEAGKRIIPIHPELIKLGFKNYWDGLQRAKSDRLFPQWNIGNDGYYSSVYSKWFGRLLGKVGLNDSRLVFHSFRHGFKDALREARIDGETQYRLMGHEMNSEEFSSGPTYGWGPSIKVLYESVCTIQYPGLDLTPFYENANLSTQSD